MRWGVAKDIVIAWIVTMPMAGLVAALFYGLAGRSLAQHELIDGHAVLARIHFSTENLDPVRRECARQIGKQAVTIRRAH